MPTLKSNTFSRLPLFLPTDDGNAVSATADTATANNLKSPENKKPCIFNSALAIALSRQGLTSDGKE